MLCSRFSVYFPDLVEVPVSVIMLSNMAVYITGVQIQIASDSIKLVVYYRFTLIVLCTIVLKLFCFISKTLETKLLMTLSPILRTLWRFRKLKQT